MRFIQLRGRRYCALSIMVVVLTSALAACGTAQTGTSGGAATTQQPTGVQRTPQPSPSATGVPGEATSIGGPITSHGGPVKDQVSLIDALRKAGATVEPGDQVEQPFLSVEGTTLAVNGADVLVFEYADEASAQAEAAQVEDILAGRGTVMIDWVAAPHFYRAGRIIVLYVGADEAMLKLLHETVGPPFAEGQGPSSPPLAPTEQAPASSPVADEVTDQASLVNALRARGLEVTPAGEVSQPFFDVQGSLLRVNGADVQVFEFADDSAAQAAMATIGPNGSPATTMIDWIATPHFYQAGRIVALYVGEDQGITEVLTNTLGPQVAGG